MNIKYLILILSIILCLSCSTPTQYNNTDVYDRVVKIVAVGDWFCEINDTAFVSNDVHMIIDIPNDCVTCMKIYPIRGCGNLDEHTINQYVWAQYGYLIEDNIFIPTQHSILRQNDEDRNEYYCLELQ
jgi:hypothetical protein